MSYTMRQARDIVEYSVLNALTNGQHRVVYLEGDPGLGKTALARAVYMAYRRYREDNIKQPVYWLSEKGTIYLTKPPSSVGKSQEIDNLHREDGFTHFVAYVAPERDVTDWGLPFPNAERKFISMLPLEDFAYAENDRPFIFLDEIDKAPQMMQNVLGRVMHEQKIGSITFPVGTFVMAAGNKMSNRAGSIAPNTHIKNRRTHIPLIADAKEWIEDVAIPWDLHVAVISYLRTDLKMIHVLDTNAPSFPSPRSWTKVAITLNQTSNLPKDKGHVERALIEGDIGVEASNTFWGHLKIYRDLRSPEVIIANPDKVPVPEGANAVPVLFAELTSLARYAKPNNVDAICRYFNRLPQEFAFCGYRDMLQRDRTMVAASKSGMIWVTKNADMLQSTKA